MSTSRAMIYDVDLEIMQVGMCIEIGAYNNYITTAVPKRLGGSHPHLFSKLQKQLARTPLGWSLACERGSWEPVAKVTWPFSFTYDDALEEYRMWLRRDRARIHISSNSDSPYFDRELASALRRVKKLIDDEL